jgi:ribosomal-protein-alanine N-acetyltransferase
MANLAAALQMMDSFIIRPLEIDDIDVACAIENKVNFSPWNQAMFTDGLRVGYHAWVVEVAGKVVGFAIFSLAVDECQIMNFAMAPAFQHRGLGSELLFFSLCELKNLGADRCYLDVRRSNVNAQELYKKFGFRQVGCRQRYYPTATSYEDALVMEVNLT